MFYDNRIPGKYDFFILLFTTQFRSSKQEKRLISDRSQYRSQIPQFLEVCDYIKCFIWKICIYTAPTI